MIAFLFGPPPPKHRALHRRRGASPHHVLPPAFLPDARMLIPFADPWERFA